MQKLVTAYPEYLEEKSKYSKRIALVNNFGVLVDGKR